MKNKNSLFKWREKEYANREEERSNESNSNDNSYVCEIYSIYCALCQSNYRTDS